MKKLFLFLFLISCAAPNSNYNVNNEILDFNKDLTFDEFNQLLIKYAETTPYPNIDQ
ncbi:hypothetical protein OAO77_01180 [Candidatus Pelagibacter sp.]|nr:hypothetical protein [Candidatus Pelagibacter sp.]